MILKQIPDKNIHDGHRERMRSKLVAHGSDIFDTYELLEMLLYNVIPFKDTNPVAKRLLAAFGNLEGVFSASREELMSVDGIGPRAADYIKAVERIPYLLGCDTVVSEPLFNDFVKAGQFFTEYFRGLLEYKVSVLFLDNSMLPIAVTDLYDVDFASAAVKTKDVIAAALECRASVAIFAHNHPFGPKFPSESDMVNNDIIAAALSRVDVMLLEHYVVCGDDFDGFMTRYNKRFAQSVNVQDFINSKKNSKSLPHSAVSLMINGEGQTDE